MTEKQRTLAPRQLALRRLAAVGLGAGALLALSVPLVIPGLRRIFGEGGAAQDLPVRSGPG